MSDHESPSSLVRLDRLLGKEEAASSNLAWGSTLLFCMRNRIFNHSVGVLHSKEISESVAIAKTDNQSEGLRVDTVSGVSKTQDTNMMMALTGAILVCFGFSFYYLSTIVPDISLIVNGSIVIFLGALTICFSVTEWQRRPWSTRVVALIGGAACVTLFIFGFFLIIILVAVLYWDVIHRIRTSNGTGTLVEW